MSATPCPAPESHECDDCGCSLSFVVGPGDYRATLCPACDADQLDALATEYDTDTPCPCDEPDAVNHDEILRLINSPLVVDALALIEWATRWADVDDEQEFLAEYGFAEGDDPGGRWPIPPESLIHFAKGHQLDDSRRTFALIDHIDRFSNTRSLLRKAWRDAAAAREAGEEYVARIAQETPRKPPLRPMRPAPENCRKGGILPRLDRLEAAIVDLVKQDPDRAERLETFVDLMGPGRPDDPQCEECGRPLTRDDSGEWGDCIDCPGDGQEVGK